MTRIQRLTAITAVGVATLAAACKESTSPAVDPTAMASAVNTFSTTFTGNAAFQSLSALSSAFTLTAPPARAAAPRAPGAPWLEAAEAEMSLMHGLTGRAPTAIQALFPANVLGKVFQWDTAGGGKYRITDSSLKAPSQNGVRFFLYVVIPGTAKPLLSSGTPQKIGTVDLIDVSTPQANVLHIVLQGIGGQTISDYTISGVKTTSSLTLTSTGFITDGVTQTTFTLSHTLTLADSSLVTDYQLNGGGTDVAMHTTLTGSGGGNAAIDWIVRKGGSIEVVGTTTPSTINVQFKFNGTTWATVGGTPAAPTFTGANGTQLTPGELLALAEILQGFGNISENLTGVFGPAFLVFK
jgi:hypothetical protein